MIREVVATPRATLPIIKQRPGTGNKPLSKDYIEKYEFPSADHPYAKMKGPELRQLLEQRVKEGKLSTFSKKWHIEKLKATLLESDGHKVPFTMVLRKGKHNGEETTDDVQIGDEDED